MDVGAELKLYAGVAQSLDVAQRGRAFSLAADVDTYMTSELENLLEAHPNAPCIIQYSVDCTPARVRQYYSHASAGGNRRSSAVRGAEYVVMNAFVSLSVGPSKMLHRVILGRPIELRHGKTMEAILGVSLGFLQQGCFAGSSESFTIFHQVHDRGMARSFREGLSTAMLQYYLDHSSNTSLSGGKRAECHFLQVDAGCALHDAQNALKWVWMTVLANNGEVLKNMHLGLSSFRSAVPRSFSVLRAWLTEVLVGDSESQCHDGATLRTYYAALGVESSLLEAISDDMRLFWDERTSKLHVRDSFLSAPHALETLSQTLHTIWHFPAFCASRWLTVGTSCRVYLVGLSTGYRHLFGKLRKSGEVGDYEGTPGEHLGRAENLFACVLGLVSWIIESFMQHVMQDARVFCNVPDLEALLLEEASFVEELDSGVWDKLALLTCLAPMKLRDVVLRGSHVALAYVYRKVIDELMRAPFSLAVGDLSQNIRELAAVVAPGPSDSLSQKLWTCLVHEGRDQSELVRVLELLRHCSCTSYFAERQHASTALVKRSHPAYDSNLLSCRAYLHTCRLQNLSPENTPHYFSALQLFLSS
eukprot:6459574-Amphidinium_carterae.4